jgi:hypothetical protein
MQNAITSSAEQAQQPQGQYQGIERLWSVMRANWGSAFDRQWAAPAHLDAKGIAAHHEQVKGYWTKELKGFSREALHYAVNNLPERPCTLPEFKAICRRAPEYHREDETKALPAPANKAAAAKVRETIGGIIGGARDLLFRQREHMRMEIEGHPLSPRQREFWRIALRAEVASLYGVDTTQPVDLQHLAALVAQRDQRLAAERAARAQLEQQKAQQQAQREGQPA